MTVAAKPASGRIIWVHYPREVSLIGIDGEAQFALNEAIGTSCLSAMAGPSVTRHPI